MMDRLSLRIRLTLWYSLAFATTLLCIGTASLWMVHRAIDDLEKQELQQRVRSVARFLEARPAYEPATQRNDAMTADYDVSHGTKWLQIIDEHGNWLYRSPHVASVFPHLDLPQQSAPDGTYFTYATGSLHVRALIEPITVNGVRYTVQTGLTLNRTLATLSNFRYQFSLLTGLGLLVSSLIGYFMSRKVLWPIGALASEAQRINDKNLNIRLPELHTRDELASLSSTLNQMLQRIEAGYQSVRSFTANAAHELRSPVALLRAETEVALAFPRNADYYRDTCERILKHSMQMSHLIDQLLALARAEAGVEIVHLEPCNLPDILDTVAAEWLQRFSDAGIEFAANFDTTEFWVEADYLAIRRLINILLENAWRYTPSGKSVVLELHIRSQQAPSEIAEIVVTDTGIGISAEDQVRVFERFYRAARPLNGDFPGSGLGLVLAQWIADCHDTTIRMDSSLGKGCRFSLLLKGTHPPNLQSQNDQLASVQKMQHHVIG